MNKILRWLDNLIPAKHRCPICRVRLEYIQRYPNYVCRECADKAVSSDGRKLNFGNVGFSGGFMASYADTGENHPSGECYIDGVKCVADEARFGGIVIEVVNPQ